MDLKKHRISFIATLLSIYSSGIYADAYRITDLGTLGGMYSWATGINNNGQVVGYADAPDGMQHPFLYSNGVMTDLGTFGGDSAMAIGINDSASIAGNVDISAGVVHGILYSNGVSTDLGSLLGGVNSWATNINNNVDVVGYTDHGFLYSNGVMTDLGTLGGPWSSANAINNLGQVAGSASLADLSSHAFIWSNGVMTDLGDLAGFGSWAYGINDLGQVVGNSEAYPGIPHAFIWSGGVMTDIDMGTTGSWAYDINNSGEVVGTLSLSGAQAFIYKNGKMTVIDSLLCPGSGWTIDGAAAINDSGQIAGVGSYNGQQHAVLLTPNPVVTDLSLSIVAKPTRVFAGQPVNYIVRVTNKGPNPATGVVVSGSLPTCSIGNIASGASAECSSSATPTAGETFYQSMSVCNNEADSNLADNSAGVSTLVTAVSDLAITMSSSTARARVGERLTYNLVITNNGPSDASSIKVLDQIPSDVVDVTVAGSFPAMCSVGKGGNIVCSLYYLPAGMQTTVDIGVTPKLPGSLVSTAIVGSNELDLTKANNATLLITKVSK